MKEKINQTYILKGKQCCVSGFIESGYGSGSSSKSGSRVLMTKN
jgi:hypothetical protein